MSYGTMAVDFEERVNYERLRKERLERAKEQVKAYNLGALLCFDFDNIRYITGTHVGEWCRNKMQRYTILPIDAEPFLYDPAAPAKRVSCPWISDRVFPAVGSMRGSIPPEVGMIEKVAKNIKETLTKSNVADKPLGVDVIDIPNIYLVSHFPYPKQMPVRFDESRKQPFIFKIDDLSQRTQGLLGLFFAQFTDRKANVNDDIAPGGNLGHKIEASLAGHPTEVDLSHPPTIRFVKLNDLAWHS